ncbi:aspartyl-phosphate phosphatase Spo0E family protein [Cytobacillus spongiae]|jgi:stage 0 sporulation regulatory protein|uniref:aspartyl-phosphate phosphatase Spo0E family protein n=1 Tax=Cytobacillus spongiae TaxID=2901381 RepID=UPI001F30179A|nr:aspartyl-phosphate phosphatase Spo0E family protein [Cytobacillus spongiae]UII56118.1 aspartyl-phosphate phosphatase Spo0E family protein [Cytobacillus spongiae]
MCVQDLLKNIEDCRREMVDLAEAYSLSNTQVVEVSTRLDHLLNKYHGMIQNKKQ